MFVIVNSKGEFIPGMGGDPRLFTAEQAKSFVFSKIEDDPDWANIGVEIQPYSPNVMHLDCIEYLEDNGFVFDISDGGDCLSVYQSNEGDWSLEQVGMLFKTLRDSEVPLNMDYPFNAHFGCPSFVMSPKLTYFFPITLVVGEEKRKIKPSFWEKEIKDARSN